MKNKFELLVVFSLWVSLAAACCPALISLVYDLPISPFASLIAFLCAFFVYSMDKVSGSKEDLLNTPERVILVHYEIRQIASMAYLLAIILVLAVDWHKLPSVLIFGLAGWIYTIKVFGHRPKDIPGLKNLIVASACSICFAGLVGTGYTFMFLLILVNTILFDVRDLAGDAAQGVRTLPVLLGTSRTIAGLAVLNICLAAYSLPAAAYGFILLWHFRQPRENLAYDFWVDGWPTFLVVAFRIGEWFI